MALDQELEQENITRRSLRAGAGARRRRGAGARVLAVVAVLLSLAGVAGLVLTVATGPLAGLLAPGRTTAGPAPVPSSASAQPASPTATPTAPPLARFDPAAPQDAVLQLFRGVLQHTVEQAGEPDGTALAAALAAAGFDPAAMQRSADRTSVDLAAPSVSVSVRVGGTCYVGQFVRAERAVTAGVTAPISTGACLIGKVIPVK